MEIRDLIHGSISLSRLELPILDSKYFQRLRQIKQLGFAENSFPSATHNRYIHSLGAMAAATQALDAIFGNKNEDSIFLSIPENTLNRFRSIVRLAALLHDIGHGPLSHTTEFAMPPLKDLGSLFPGSPKSKLRKATHEDYTLKMILDSGLTPLLAKAGAPLGFKPIHVAALIEPKIEISDDCFTERCSWNDTYSHPVDFRPLLKQLISSELDADRMDYLRRDSLQAGVSYGQFDFNWLVRNLTFHVENHKGYLALQHRALYAFEDFLISRFHMFLMVYFHHKSVIFDEMLGQYFSSPDCDYTLPADIEKYCESNDAQLYGHLAQTNNPWAKRIIEKRPYRMLVELHSGIPAVPTARVEQEKLLEQIKKDLEAKQIHFLSATSTSELSKYFRRPVDPIFVRYDNQYSEPSFIPLEQCTDLFRRYSEKRFITRLYIAPEDYSYFQKSQSFRPPLKYDQNETFG